MFYTSSRQRISQTRPRFSSSPWISAEVSSDCEQADIHLIKLEAIFFPTAIGGYCSVAIQNSVDELRPFGFGQTARPFDAAYRTESGKSRPRPKIPRMISGINTQYPETIALCLGCVL